jgi:hypothetical protein
MSDLSEYELQRLRTIESNESRLKEILGDAAQRCRKEKVEVTAEQLEQRQLAKEQRHRELLANQRGSSSRIQEKRAREAEQDLAQPGTKRKSVLDKAATKLKSQASPAAKMWKTVPPKLQNVAPEVLANDPCAYCRSQGKEHRACLRLPTCVSICSTPNWRMAFGSIRCIGRGNTMQRITALEVRLGGSPKQGPPLTRLDALEASCTLPREEDFSNVVIPVLRRIERLERLVLERGGRTERVWDEIVGEAGGATQSV